MKKPRLAKKIGRKRRAAGWTLLVLGVVVAGLWAWSGWGTRRLWNNGSVGLVEHGRFVYYKVNHPFDRNVYWGPRPHWEWLDLWYHWSRPGSTFCSVLLWPAAVATMCPAALLLRSGTRARRRATGNACIKCGYSLAGLAKGAACPECGKSAGTT